MNRIHGTPLVGALVVALSFLAGHPTVAPAVPPQQVQLQPGICADALRDTGSPGDCIEASSVPTLGKLLPQSESLFVHPSGRVGIGTTFPFRTLDVIGDLAVNRPGSDPRVVLRPSLSGQFGILETVARTTGIGEVTNLISTSAVDPQAGALATLRAGTFLTALTTPAGDPNSGFVLVRNANVDVAGIDGSSGEVFGASKSFVQPHPSDASLEIQYVSLEGSEHGVYFRGTARLERGSALLSPPESFRLVARDEGLTVSLTPLGPSRGLWVESKTLDGILVHENPGGKGDVRFDYLVMGVRSALPDHQALRPNVHFAPRPGTRIAEGALPGSYRELMIANGTLLPDGRVDEARAAELGYRREGSEWRAGPGAAAPVARD